jgi:large subunit ribosomal protein L10
MTVRRGLRAAGVKYLVAKKTIAKKAWSESAKEGTMPDLPGEFAVAYSEDDFAPAREMYKLQKTFKGRLSIVGGVFEKHFATAEEMTNIASIPSREVLYAQFLNIINSPIQGLVMTLDQIAQKKETV